jgi:hypothetical protein
VQSVERVKEAIQVCLEAEKLEDILLLKFVGIQQEEVKYEQAPSGKRKGDV